MFTLLAPFALAASAVLAVPVVIHLLKPKRLRTMPFSSLRWLRSSKHKLSRRIQWHQLLLFFLRAAFLTALVLALAKPIFSPGGRQGLSERFVVVDVSRSMGYSAPGIETPLDRAKQAALGLLRHGLPGDRTTVILTGHRATALGPLTADPDVYAARLESAQVHSGNTDLSSALALIRPQLETPRPGAQAELFFITDNAQDSWSQTAILEFTAGLQMPLSVHIIDVGPLSPVNAWIADVRAVQREGRPFLRARLGASGPEPIERTLRLRKPATQGDASQKITLFPGAIAEVTLPLAASTDPTEQLAELILEPGDALPDDDSFWLHLDSGGPRILVLEPMTTQIDSLQPGYHVRSALEALFNDRADGPQVLRRTPDTVAASDFAGADIVVMANVPELTDDRLLALENRVKDGAGLLLFLGPASQSDFYNKHLHRPSRPDMSLLPAPLAGVASGRLASLTRLDWTHPLLAPFSDPVLSDLTRVRASAYYRFATQPRTDATQILSRFEDGTPAAMEHLLGAGRVLVFNTTANDEWSDLPRRASFLPLLDRVLHRIAFSKHGRQFSAGEPVLLRVPALGENTRVSIAGPSGRSVSFAREGDGARSFIRVEEAEPAGVYAVRASGETGDFETSFIVHSGLDDARCLRMDPETLRLWWNGASFKITQPDVKNDTPNPPTAERVFLWPFLLAAAAFLLMAEMHLVHRLTPAMNPALVGSTVAQHGLFRTVSPKEARP